MANPPERDGKHWRKEEIAQLRQLAAGNTPTRVIGLKMERTETAVYSKAQEKNISLKPTNQSPRTPKRK